MEGVLAISRHTIEDRFAFFDTKFKVERNADGRKEDPTYTYVNRGFLDFIWWGPAFPVLSALHVGYLYCYYLLLTGQLNPMTLIVTTCLFTMAAGLGNTAGVHRLWCHRAYNASWPWRVYLMVGHVVGGQYSLYRWSWGHRTHHKFADTDADPHNVKRGFCFAHFGWMTKKEHPLVLIKSKTIDFSDINQDPVAKFNFNYYYQLHFVFGIFLPILANMVLADESFFNSFLVGVVMRMTVILHDTALVNSAAHMFGDRPYNSKIASVENSWVSWAAIGEGYHNYHHAYPWDYGAGENGNMFNLSKQLIDILSYIGITYNLKQATPDMIRQAKEKVLNNNCEEVSTY